MVKPPYGVIWGLLKQGNVVPFLGAGASLVGRDFKIPWNGPESKCLPTAKELAGYLAEESEFPSQDEYDRRDLAKVSSYYADVSGRPRLKQVLRDVLCHELEPGPIHRLLASVPVHQVIVSTNYDTLIEQAFRDAGKPYDLVIYPADRLDFCNAVMWWPNGAASPEFIEPNLLKADLSKASLIYKMHGTVVTQNADFDNYVVTEDDYVDFLSRMDSAVPARLIELFRPRSFLFLGYGLRDWNLRVVLKNVSRHLVNRKEEGELPSWAIQLNPSELECELWRNRKVRIFDVDLQEFVNKLQQQAP